MILTLRAGAKDDLHDALNSNAHMFSRKPDVFGLGRLE